jgi:hypothetical protein
MNIITVDDNSRPVPFCTELGYGENVFELGMLNLTGKKIVRFVAYDDYAVIRSTKHIDSKIMLPENGIQYFFVGKDEDVELLFGKVNITY